MKKIKKGIDNFEDKLDKWKPAIYGRVSTREQAKEGYSIDGQVRKCTSYLTLYEMKHDSIEVYADEGVSAKNTNRKRLQELLTDVRNKKVNLVIIQKLDRLSRDVCDTYDLINFFINQNCNLISVNDNLDLSNANGRFMLGILATMAQWERETIAERTIDGMTEMVEEGLYPFAGKPFGCDKDENLKLYVNEKEKEIFNFMLDLLLSGKKITEVGYEIQYLYGIKMNYDRIRKLLLSEKTYGELEFRGRTYYDIVPPIASKERVASARQMMNKRSIIFESGKYYFRNKIRCRCGEICAAESTKKKNKQYYYYKCQKCNQRINQDKVVDQVITEIITQAKDSDDYKLNKRLLKKVANINKKIIEVHEAFSNNIIDTISYTAAMYKYQKDRENILLDLELSKTKEYINWESLNDKQRISFINNYVQYIEVHMAMQVVIDIKLNK